MKGLYVSNQKDPVAFFQRGLITENIELLVFPKFKSEYDLFEVIQLKKPDFLIINVDVVFSTRPTENWSGISFLLYARMMNFNKPCVCFGREPLLSMIKQKTCNAILLSEGNCYVIPFQSELEEVIIGIALQKHADNTSLVEIVKGNLDLEKVRHEWANYWGIYRLFESHLLFEKKFAGKNIEQILPDNLQQKLLSYEGVALRYLYGKEPLRNDRSIRQQVVYCNELRGKLKSSNAKVLYIDDQANFGWSEILQEIIYGHKDELLFKTIKPETDFNEEKLISRLNKEILMFKPHVLLLDVRLRNEKGAVSIPDELSGLKLLAKIRKQIPDMPVIMFTASNKSNTIIRCKELGAYDVWIKEGIDERLSYQDAVSHYFQLVRLIYECVSFVSERANKFLFGLEFPLAQFERKAEDRKIAEWIDNIPGIQQKDIRIFGQFDICLIDTNIFLFNNQYTLNAYKALWCLLNLRSKSQKRVTILNQVYNEVIQKAKIVYNKNQKDQDLDLRTKTARFAFNKLQSYIDNRWIDVFNYTAYFTGSNYADPELISFVDSCVKKRQNVLFITNDRGLRESVYEKVTKKINHSLRDNYRLMKASEMIYIMKPLLKSIDSSL